jgi:hypothetical protein
MNNSKDLFTDEYDYRPYNEEIYNAIKQVPSFLGLLFISNFKVIAIVNNIYANIVLLKQY